MPQRSSSVTTPPSVTCLVTGCAGFVGSHLCDALLDEGLRVIGVDDFSFGLAKNLAGCLGRDQFILVPRDITEQGWFDAAVELGGTPTHIFHLAAISGVAMASKDPERAWQVNLEASRDLHRRAQENGALFVFAGSAAEYGDSVQPQKESAANVDSTPISIYGCSKYLTSRLIADSGHGCSLRFFNIYGPRQSPTSSYAGVISAFMAKALAGQPLTIYGKGDQTRDFIYIEDSIKAYFLAAGLLPGSSPLTGIFNVGTGRATSVLDIADAVAELVGDTGTVYLPSRKDDILHSTAGISKIAKVGFKTETSLEDGLLKTISWHRSLAKANAAT